MSDDHAISRGVVNAPGLVVMIEQRGPRSVAPVIDVEPVRGPREDEDR